MAGDGGARRHRAPRDLTRHDWQGDASARRLMASSDATVSEHTRNRGRCRRSADLRDLPGMVRQQRFAGRSITGCWAERGGIPGRHSAAPAAYGRRLSHKNSDRRPAPVHCTAAKRYLCPQHAGTSLTAITTSPLYHTLRLRAETRAPCSAHPKVFHPSTEMEEHPPLPHACRPPMGAGPAQSPTSFVCSIRRATLCSRLRLVERCG